MAARSLADWLRWQESLHPQSIDLSLDRVARVLERLALPRPTGGVITVAGTNGKGSTVTLLQDFALAAGERPGLYTSPHLVRYNERIRIGGQEVVDDALLVAFEAVERVRGDVPLTYFEYGTLAALLCFAEARCDSWILEVGLGGRLDAVNAVEPDVSLITTIGLDHEEWLGDTVELIAAEKAGILRAGRPAFYGDAPVPAAIRERAHAIGARFETWKTDFDADVKSDGTWRWTRHGQVVDGLEAPPDWTGAQFRNAALVLAALSEIRPSQLGDSRALNRVFAASRPPGRFQRVEREHEWILDVAHNPQAAEVLRAQLSRLPARPPGKPTFVTALLADKAIAPFIAALMPVAGRWILTRVDDPRASSREVMSDALREAGVQSFDWCESPDAAFERAMRDTPRGGRIVVCGSFRLVGPALGWLGLY